jgi:CofD-related protein of GAK system
MITPFDSGGSSKEMRKAFHMPAVGDLRNRMMALADQSVRGNPDIARLFAHRLPKTADPEELEETLQLMVRGKHPMVAAVLDPMRKIIRNHLGYFQRAKPPDFNLRGASVGNMVLTGGYLNNGRRLEAVLYLFAKLAEVRGTVRPVINEDLNLVAELEDGNVIVGQHNLTGREAPAITSPVRRLFLSEMRSPTTPFRPAIREKQRRLIREAELICYPMGSFYSSVIANFLPHGVADAIADMNCPKVYIPNTGVDPETPGGTVEGATKMLLKYLRQGASQAAAASDLLDFVILDAADGAYTHPPDVAAIEDLGVTVIDMPLTTEAHYPYLDPDRLGRILLSLI